MKKALLLLTLAMTLAFGMRAQEITIGDGTSVVTSMAFFANYNDSWCECTFLASELNASGSILSISLHANGNAFQCEEVNIYMGHRTADNYNNSTSFTPASDLTLVYSATSTTIGSIDGWEEYQFQTPFEYNGTDNLVVVFAKHATYYLSALKYYYTESGSQYHCLYRRADNNIAYSQHPGSATGTTSNRRPNVKLLFGNSDCIQPLGVQAGGFTDEGCTVSWLANENGYYYDYQLKQAGDSWSTATMEGTYDTTVTLTNLSPSTTYDFRVRTDCGDTASTWVDLSFTTLQVAATLPYNCDFNDLAENAMWQLSSSDYNHWVIGTGTSYGNDGNDMSLYVSNDVAGTYAADSLVGSYLFAERIIDFGETPETYELSFDWKCSGYAQGTSLYGGVAVFMLDADVEETTEFPTYMNESLVFGAQLNDWSHITTQLTDVSGYKKLQFFTWGYSAPEARLVPAAVDNISIQTSGCVTPTMSFEPGAQTVVITHDGPADGTYYLQYRMSGTSTMLDTTFMGSSVTLEGLQMNTAYVAWISQICGTDTSAVSSGSSFSTTCGTAVVTNSFPWTETFTSYPSCWSMMPINSWQLNSEGFIRHPYGNYSSEVITPVLDVTAVTYPCVKFDERRPDYGNSGVGDHLQVYFRTLTDYDTAEWVLLGSFTDVTSTFRTDSLMLPTGLSLIQLKFAATGMGDDADGCSLDNVKVYNLTNPPACMPPIALNANNITSTSADLSWMMITNGDVNLHYKSASDQTYTTVTDVMLTDGVYLLDNLTTGTAYQWYLTLGCNGDSISSAEATFVTDCGLVQLPYMQDFDYTEPYTNPLCWNQINPYAGYPQVNAGNAHSANNALKFMCNPSGNAPVYAVLPEFDADFSELQINFWTRRESASSGTLSVGYVTDLADASTFVPLMSVSSDEIGDDDYHNYLVKFDSVVTDDTLHYHITFKYGQNTSWYWFVDDIQVTIIPPCSEPESLSADNITISSADLSWTGNASSFVVYYRAEGDSVYSEVNNVTLTNGVYTLGGLAAGTRYEWYVASVCDNGIIAPAFNTQYFITQCHALSQFPVTWDFESDLYGGNTSYPLPLCWSRIGVGPNARYPYVATNANNSHSGTHYLTIYNMYSGAYGVLPELDETVLSVQDAILTFYAKASFSSPAMLEVGVMTDPTDASTFTPVQTFSLNLSYSIEPLEVLFYTYTGNGRYIAFRNVTPSDVTASFYLDDVTVDVAPPCARPQNLTSTAATSSSVTLSWAAAPGQTQWEIAYGNFGFNPNNTSQVVTATSNPFEVTGLSSATTYQFYVRAVCSPTETSVWSQASSGATECGTTALPYSEDFESYQGSTYTDNHGIAPTCWTTFGTNTVYGAPHITSGGDYHYTSSGSNSMVFTSGSAGSESYAALPTFTEALNTLRLNFWCAMESAYHGTMTVGYVTDLSLIGATFVPIDTIPAVFPEQATTFTVDFTGEDIPASGNICFRWSYPESYYSCCIDDIEVIAIGAPAPEPCDAPTGLHVTNVANEAISVAWDANADVETWYVRHRPVNGSWATITATTNSYTITGLTGLTTYEIQVQAGCGDDNLSDWSGSVSEQTTNVGIENWLQNSVVLFPNPAKEYVDIRIDGELNVTGMEVYDVYGKLINTVGVCDTPVQTRINVSNLANGMYFMRVTTEEGVVTKTFVKR